ncbi:MAG: regulator of chromosome condensation [Myxococcales bacterium]|nr:regulator of chromosome condensation [Myxococcales bacterium]
MRTLIMAVLALFVASACNVRRCKKGTVLLTVKLDASASSVDTFDVALSIAGGSPQHASINKKTGTSEGTVEIDFAQGYMAGSQLSVAVTGNSNGIPIAFGTTTQALGASCESVTVVVGASGAVKQVGDPAVPGDNCVSGHIVDGYCCDRECQGQCEACDVVPGGCQPVLGTPHATRPACEGTGVSPPCGPKACDGVTAGSCTWPTSACGAATCSNGMASSAGTCSNGTCQTPVLRTCPGGICGATDCATVTQVAAGSNHTCALLSDATVRCWGANDHGQLGLGENSTMESHVPAPVVGLADVAHVVAGYQHTCALLKNGTIQCWGSNLYGALGRGTYDPLPDTAPPHGAPQPVLSSVGGTAFTGVKEIASGAGASHTCVSLTNGEGWCWGTNGKGQIGNGASVSGYSGQLVPAGVCASGMGCANGAQFHGLSVGGQSTCSQGPTGNNYCWGSNASGQLALQPQDFNAHPNPVATNPGGSASNPIVGEAFGCVVNVDGTGRVQCWGSNSNGALGNGTTSGTFTSPVHVCVNANCETSITDQLANAAQVAVGGFACVLRLGAAKCWGPNNVGQLGDGTMVANNPLATSTAITANVAAVTVGDNHACALLTDGTVQCWGQDTNGQLGDNDPGNLNKRTPVAPHW